MTGRPPRLATDQAAFTVVEVLLAMTVAVIMIGVMFSITFNYFSTAMQSQAAADMALESQGLLGQIVEDLRLADGVSASGLLTDSNAPVGGWVTSDYLNQLIIESPAVTTTRDIIYDTSTGSPYRNEYVYFMSGSSMYKRVIKNAAATDNMATSTCPAAAVSSTCQLDRVFSSDVQDFSFTFYDTNNVVTSDPALANSIYLSVVMTRKVFGKDITIGNATQITQRN